MLMPPPTRVSPQTPDGLIFPDRATLYVTAIEDRQYKDYKIHCEWGGGERGSWGGGPQIVCHPPPP